METVGLEDQLLQGSRDDMMVPGSGGRASRVYRCSSWSLCALPAVSSGTTGPLVLLLLLTVWVEC